MVFNETNETLSNNTIPTVPDSTISRFITSPEANLIAFICSILALALSSYNIQKHLIYYNRPSEQRSIIRVLIIVPVYAVFSFLTLIFPAQSIYFESIRDLWEAIVVYSFLNLMLEYCGGENACLSVIMNNPGSISLPCPLNYCTPPIPLTSTFFRWCKRATLQFVFVKPVMVFFNLLFFSLGKYDDRGYQIGLSVVYNTSYTIALGSLLLFYKATHSHPGLVNRNPLYKFLAVKTVVFATYYQSVIIPRFPTLSPEAADAWSNFLLCCEMVIFAILHLFSFSYREYKNLPKRSTLRDSFSEFDDPSNTNANGIELSKERSIAMKNARDVMSVTDVAKDAYYNFNAKYGSHVQLGTENDPSPNVGGQNLTSIDLQSKDSEEGESRNMFAKIKTTLKSVQTGGAVRDAQDDGERTEFPFQNYTTSDGKPEQQAGTTQNENPFLEDYNDPRAIEANPPKSPKNTELDLQ